MIPVGWLLPNLKTRPHPMLAKDTVRYVGDAVAVVVAEDRYTGARRRRSGRGRLRAAAARSPTPRRAVAKGAPLRCTTRRRRQRRVRLGDRRPASGPTTRSRSAAHTASIELRNNRLIPHAIEPRSALADFDPTTGKLDAAPDHPEPARPSPADDAGVARPARAQDARDRARGGRRLRLARSPTTPTRRSSSFCSMQLGRPVKWTATRSETNLTDAHGRDHVTKAAIALDADHRIIGLSVDTYADLGRLPLDLRARGADLSLRHAALRRSTTSRRSTAT